MSYSSILFIPSTPLYRGGEEGRPNKEKNLVPNHLIKGRHCIAPSTSLIKLAEISRRRKQYVIKSTNPQSLNDDQATKHQHCQPNKKQALPRSSFSLPLPRFRRYPHKMGRQRPIRSCKQCDIFIVFRYGNK